MIILDCVTCTEQERSQNNRMAGWSRSGRGNHKDRKILRGKIFVVYMLDVLLYRGGPLNLI